MGRDKEMGATSSIPSYVVSGPPGTKALLLRLREVLFSLFSQKQTPVWKNDDWKSCRGHNTFNFFEINNS